MSVSVVLLVSDFFSPFSYLCAFRQKGVMGPLNINAKGLLKRDGIVAITIQLAIPVSITRLESKIN